MISSRIPQNESFIFAARTLRVGAGAVVFALLAASAACGGATQAVKDDGKDAGAEGGVVTTPVDGGVKPTVDAGAPGSDGAVAAEAGPGPGNGAPSSTYPAFTVDVAKVVDNGGPVLKAPVVITITWSSDPDADTYNALGDAMGPSTYWKDVSSEYGVGPTASGSPNHISITTAAPTTISDDELDSMVETNAGTAWPAPTDDTLYAIYLPPGAALTSGGQNLCQEGVGGYHTESNTKNYVYAIMPHCSGFQTADVEIGASHELNEAATDPHPGTNPAWVGFDDDHLAFEFFNEFQDELGDACEAYVEATDPTDLTPYTVQRQWSNESAAAGSHWCVPKLAEPFYNTTFLPQTNLDTITVNLNSVFQGAGSTTTKGLKIPVNTSRTFPIGLFSDQATSGPFTVDVQGTTDPITQDEQGNDVANGKFTVTLDLTSGVNGQIANLTVTPTSYSALGINFFYVRAVLPGAQQHHYLPILISAN